MTGSRSSIHVKRTGISSAEWVWGGSGSSKFRSEYTPVQARTLDVVEIWDLGGSMVLAKGVGAEA